MAHQTNVTQVKVDLKSSTDFPDEVRDPVCDTTLERKMVRHLLVRGEQTYYFCSKDCQQQFIVSTGRRRAA